MNTIIRCPHCGLEVEVTEALAAQIEKQLMHAVTEKHAREIEEIRKSTESKMRKQLLEESAKEIAGLEKQLEEKNRKVGEMRDQELALREAKRKLEDREKELKLEVARTIDAEKKKLEEAVLKQAAEEHRLRDMEKDKLIRDLQQSLEDARRKAHQGSQQLQGEVQELDLEETLRNAFPMDIIEPVEKGIRGADLRQIVRTPRGSICGVILWEAKRTKLWSDDWLVKLKDDLRHAKANIPIIVSAQLPQEAVSGFGFKNGVYVVSFALAVPVAEVFRQKLTEIAREKFISANRGTKGEELYAYITSHQFRQQVESLVEVYQDIHSQIQKERAALEKIWKSRESQVVRLMHATAGMIGSMEGLVGQSFLQIKGLDLDTDNPELSESPKLIE
ncbi:hypothetical protein A2Z33_06865 [Candidatus Gottesmanbacteria bacterium RBG_16_52_11]|uniref:DUF2130 domain-containing protein n=1 Tax=Candidatus Gottesmanbacteria bacterium RBG_16_52_11 TaxID=1798374 RepID=A0A1F5YY28_9BACT|nr:MAG: hypothetical protein A2Z33_06865 [Candidatus Gottesmanbacteria bacterium RBG_16_52_11]